MTFFDEIFAPLRRLTAPTTSAIYDGKDRQTKDFQKSVLVRDIVHLPVLSGEPVFQYDISTARYGPSLTNYSAFSSGTGWRAIEISPRIYVIFSPENPFELIGETTFVAQLVNFHAGKSILAEYKVKCEGKVGKLSEHIYQYEYKYFARDTASKANAEDLYLGEVRTRHENQQMTYSESKWIFYQGETLRLKSVQPDFP